MGRNLRENWERRNTPFKRKLQERKLAQKSQGLVLGELCYKKGLRGSARLCLHKDARPK